MKIDRFSFPLKTHKLWEPGEPFEVSVPITPTENILEHGTLYGRKVVFTCTRCGCRFEIPATQALPIIGVNSKSAFVVFSTQCPECNARISNKESYRDWFEENDKEV